MCIRDSPKAREAVEYLKEICAKMGAQGLTSTPVKQGEATILKVECESAGTLIGHRGEVMEALSYLTSLVANRAGGDYMKIGCLLYTSSSRFVLPWPFFPQMTVSSRPGSKRAAGMLR